MIKRILLAVMIVSVIISAAFGQKKTLIYPSVPPYLNINVALAGSLTPTFTVVHAPFAITPDIHRYTGLNFDPATGVISGTPTIADSRSYIVTATKPNGKRFETSININVVNNTGSYTPSVSHLYIDSLFATRPTTPPADTLTTRYSCLQDLPKGLRLDFRTGEINGRAENATGGDQSNQPYIIIGNTSGTLTAYTVYIDVTGYANYVAKPATISFVGQGDIQQSLNNKSKLAANTGIGVVFRQNSSRRYGILHDIEINFSINVASTVDTIRSINDRMTNKVTNQTDFGNSVLLPLNSGQAFSFSFKGFFSERGGPKGRGNYMRNAPPRSLLGVLSGMYVSVSGSNRNWEYDSITVVNDVNKITATSVKSSLLSFYVGPFFEFVTPKKSNNYGQNSSITLGMGYSGRLILGDVQQGNNTSFRTKLLGENAKKFYSGPEVMLALRFYSIKAEVHLPIFSNKHEAPGLSGAHLTTFIGFSGGFPLDLSKPNNQ